MVVCSCRAVTDGTVRDAIAGGVSSVAEITAHCDAASDCGGCWPELERLLETHGRATRPEHAHA